MFASFRRSVSDSVCVCMTAFQVARMEQKELSLIQQLKSTQVLRLSRTVTVRDLQQYSTVQSTSQMAESKSTTAVSVPRSKPKPAELLSSNLVACTVLLARTCFFPTPSFTYTLQPPSNIRMPQALQQRAYQELEAALTDSRAMAAKPFPIEPSGVRNVSLMGCVKALEIWGRTRGSWRSETCLRIPRPSSKAYRAPDPVKKGGDCAPFGRTITHSDAPNKGLASRSSIEANMQSTQASWDAC